MARLQDIAHVADTMRESPIQVPDFTSSILDRVDVERPFLAPSVRRKLPWVRIGLGGCVVATTLSVALTHRWAPRTMQLAEQPAPISNVVQCVQCTAIQKLVEIRPAAIRVTERDASEFIAAVAAATRVAENEGQFAVRMETPMKMTALLPLSQAVSLDMPAPPTIFLTSSPVVRSVSTDLPAWAVGPRSMPGSRASMMMSSAEIPKVKAVPSFLEHDLEGFVFPR